MFKSTLIIATSVFLLTTGTDALFAMKRLEDADQSTSNKALGLINHMPKELMKGIFIETSKNTSPRRLTFVCKSWFHCIREETFDKLLGQKDKLNGDKLSYLTMKPFMQLCMNTYWENLFYNGILRYSPVDNYGRVIEGSAAVTLKFSDFKDGTFDLSKCGNMANSLVITENMNQFFKVGEENKDKTVVGIMPRRRIQQEIKNAPDHPFASLMTAWDADKAPVGIFWRWGNDEDLSWVNYLTTTSAREISSRDLYENYRASGWNESVAGQTRGRNAHRWSEFHIHF